MSSGKRNREIKKMCKAFCISAGIKWTRKFERMYRKEFFASHSMQIKPLAVRRAEAADARRHAKTEQKPAPSLQSKVGSNLPPATEGEAD